MLKFRSPLVLQLHDGELLRVDDALWLSVVRGRVWVTRADDPDDHFLEGGQAMRLARRSGAIVGAEGPAQVALAAAPSPWRALLRQASQWAPRWTARRHSWISLRTN